MAGDATADLLARGEAALRDCTFEDARAAFSEALAQVETPEGFDGMARALWWLRDVEKAVANRERAYADFRRAGDLERAASIAMWLSREYAQALGNDAISRGWLARAEGLVAKLPGSAAEGRLALARGRLAADASLARSAAEGALEIAREVGDPEVFGDVCCLATRAGEESGEIARLMQWNSVVMGFMQRSGHVPLLEFCGTCCAEVLVAGGNLDEAEGWLVRTLRELEDTGHRSRCIHPAAKLAELRLLQGRREEAARLLAGLEDRPDALRAAAMLHLEAGETSVAAALLHRRLNQVGESLLAAPLLALLVDAELAHGDLAAAADTARRLAALAERADTPRLHAAADLATGLVALAAGDPDAGTLLSGAADGFAKLEMPIEGARARLALARSLREPELAVHEAGVALETAEAAGANRLADEAAALLRDLGGPARTGPKQLGLLSERETEVLRLVAEGLTNAEIAARLFISTKTAGHHVGSILAKLGLRTRTEAAAFASRYLAPAPG